MSIEFYIPQQGDTAGTVTDGYTSNFEALDTAKADAQTVAEALADKVDKAEGKELMTSAEREKLAGIEAGANAYAHPESHSADMITDTVDKVIMTSAEREKLSGIEAGANAYTLPAASASALGGIKVGRNLSIDTEGRLSAVGGSGSGGGILVLPYVAPARDADGNLTNSAAFVDAWGGILSEYLAAPDSHALYMDTEAGEGLMIRIPCTFTQMGAEADAVQWLLSGFAVVNIPGPGNSILPCKTIVMAAVVCNASGEMQSLTMYAGEGIAAADGKPNLLSADDAMIVEIPDNATEDQLKTILQPVVTELQLNPRRQVIVRYGVMLLPAATGITDVDFIIAAINANPLTANDIDSTMVVKVAVYCRISGGVIQSAAGGVTGYELATTEAVKTAINEIPYLGENLLLESRGPWIRHSMGDIKALPLSTGFLTQGETYVFSYVDGCTAPAYPTFHLLTRNGPDIIQQIEPGVPFVATRSDWEYIFIRKGNEGGICTVSRLKLERGTKVTSWACAPTEAGPLPYSLDEQLVPGEFWQDVHGNMKQVYIRSMTGTTAGVYEGTITTQLGYIGLTAAQLLRCSIYDSDSNSLKAPTTELRADSGVAYLCTYNVPDNYWSNRRFVITFKYIK